MFVLLHFVVQQAGRWYIEVGMKRGGPTAKQGCFVFFGGGGKGCVFHEIDERVSVGVAASSRSTQCRHDF